MPCFGELVKHFRDIARCRVCVTILDFYSRQVEFAMCCAQTMFAANGIRPNCDLLDSITQNFDPYPAMQV
jgi:hypothetical protein